MYNARKTFVALFAFAAISFGAEAQNKKTTNQAETKPETKEVLIPEENKPVKDEGGKAVTTPAGTDKPTPPNQAKQHTPPPAPSTPQTPTTSPASKQPLQGSADASPNQVKSSNSVDIVPDSKQEPKAVQNNNAQRKAPAKKGK